MTSAGIIGAFLVIACVSSTFANTIDSWGTGFKATECSYIKKDIYNWKAHLLFDKEVTSLEVFAGTYDKYWEKHFRVNGPSGSVLRKGDTHCVTFIATCKSGDCQSPKVTVYIEGNRSSKNYAHALDLSILFYCAQRSGKLPANNPISWRGDSALQDCVVGGWYDAGDHVKFGLPMAASTTVLAWSVIRYKAGYQRAGKLNDVYDSIRWPLDYFVNCWDSGAQTFVAQIGDGKKDHAYWGRAEDMSMPRPCKKISAQVPGSDIAGETAASLAAGSIVFQDKGEYAYAGKLLHAAKTLYEFAKGNRGIFTGAKPYYKSSGDKDEMCLGAMFLYKATKEQKYLDDAKSFVEWSNAWALTWDDKKLACQTLLYEATYDDAYKNLITGYFHSWSRAGGMQYTPCGLAWLSKWGVNRYAANSAFMALIAADLGVESYKYRKWAVEQINYLLGDNNLYGGCFVFQVGNGNKYPHFAHHRGASCPSQPNQCGMKFQSARTANIHVLKGALVGGPTEPNGNYRDERDNYVSNEVTTDYNAGFQGALAAILQLEGSVDFPWTETKPECRCD